MEIWKDIKGFKGYYQVSNQGRIKSLYRLVKRSGIRGKRVTVNERILKIHLNGSGYYHIQLRNKNGKRFTERVHRLVALAFISNPHNKSCVNHTNGVKTDNYIVNLQWCTHSENTQHSFDTGLQDSSHCLGSNHHLAKLIESDAIEIRDNKLNLTRIELSKKYGVSKNQITNIKFGRAWKHI